MAPDRSSPFVTPRSARGGASRGPAEVQPMARIVWLLVIALVVYVFGSAAWKVTQTALKPQTVAHPEL